MDISIIDGCTNEISGKISSLLADYNAKKKCSTYEERYTVVAKQENNFVGGANVLCKWDWVFIDHIYVINKRQGIGRKLVERIESVALEKNKRGVYLFSGNFQAPGFYKSLGYKEAGRIPKFINGYDEILFLKELL